MEFTTKKTYNTEQRKERIEVSISLDDPCGNGHNDFSITATIYELRGKRWVYVAEGCLHEKILKHFPEFKIFVDLHMCDDNGVPMYPIANNPYTGFFAQKKGQSLINAIEERLPELKQQSKEAIDKLCELTGQTYVQTDYSEHLFRETKCKY